MRDGRHGIVPIVVRFGGDARRIDARRWQNLVGHVDIGGWEAQGAPALRPVFDASIERIWHAEHFVRHGDIALADRRANSSRAHGAMIKCRAPERVERNIGFATKPAQIVDIARFTTTKRKVIAQDDGNRIER